MNKRNTLGSLEDSTERVPSPNTKCQVKLKLRSLGCFYKKKKEKYISNHLRLSETRSLYSTEAQLCCQNLAASPTHTSPLNWTSVLPRYTDVWHLEQLLRNEQGLSVGSIRTISHKGNATSNEPCIPTTGYTSICRSGKGCHQVITATWLIFYWTHNRNWFSYFT